MSDTIKLIVEIPKDYYEMMQKNEVILGSSRSSKTLTSVIYSAVAHGTPLDVVKAEIEQTAKDYDKFDDHRRVRGLWIALEIIDKITKQKAKMNK